MLCFAGEPGGGSDRPELDFWVGRSASSSFPLSVWRRIIGRLLDHESQYLTDYSDPAGLPELRSAIADYLGRSRGVVASPDQIIVTCGGQEALNLVTELMRPQSESLCIETPCYVGASMVFTAEDMPITPVPVDRDGLNTNLLPDSKRNLIYVTPSHQFPTGETLSLNRRLSLLRWAEETDSYIIEDDYDSDFRYDGPPLMALAGLDQGRRVFYIGTYSKSVGAGLRVGFVVVPRRYWSDARLLKARMSNGQSWLEQRALSEFLREGHFERHCANRPRFTVRDGTAWLQSLNRISAMLTFPDKKPGYILFGIYRPISPLPPKYKAAHARMVSGFMHYQAVLRLILIRPPLIAPWFWGILR